ncbi:hypothetical protein [Robertkochia solimangrovi]|uniref:hypothetical protein n=1 Tax=Robertkochia solimangrovi TaxID=2213046 RepID=UPI00117FD78B|nr:hypothetical protein [Robertkochia solimangrovi]TRZ46414.1 hypothetical protein DMZ48_03970 [Robertkochia solimangrovi]
MEKEKNHMQETQIPTAVLIDEMTEIVRYYCGEIQEYTEISEFDNVATAVIKKYFNAREVFFDHRNKKIILRVNVTVEKNPMIKSAFSRVTLDYENLDDFVISLLETDQESLQYYRNLLKFRRIGKS